MPPPAASMALRAQSPTRIARAVEETLDKVARPAGGLVFVSGTPQVGAVAQAVAELARKTPMLVVGGAGVLTERGEIEDQPAAAAIVWSGGHAETLAIDGSTADDVGESLGRAVSDRAARSARTAIVFVRPEGIGPAVLEPLSEARGAGYVFGGGSVAGAPVYAIDADGRANEGAAVMMVLRNVAPPVIRASPACRLLMPLRRISECRGSMVVRVEDEAALDVLSDVGRDLSDQPLVFAVLAEESPHDPSAEATNRPDLLVRAVQGVDPVRRGLLISEEVREGMRIAFAVRDPVAARSDLEAAARELEREIGGALPRFGVYVNCAGRGMGLYRTPDVDTRLLKTRLGEIPIAGLQSSFEIAPHAGRPKLQLYTGVVAVFTAPS